MSYYHQRASDSSPPPPPPLPAGRLRLYHVERDPYTHRVQLVLDAKRVPYDTCTLDPSRLPQWFRDKNPRLKIPMLEVPTQYGDQCLFESIVICDYVDEAHSPSSPLHARDPFRKAQDRLLIERFNELIKGSLDCFDTNFAFGSEQIVHTLDTFEKELVSRGTNYFGGARPGMLDYMIWPWVERLYLLRCVDEKKFEQKKHIFPNLADWGELMQAEPVVKRLAHSPLQHHRYYRSARDRAAGLYL